MQDYFVDEYQLQSFGVCWKRDAAQEKNQILENITKKKKKNLHVDL